MRRKLRNKSNTLIIDINKLVILLKILMSPPKSVIRLKIMRKTFNMSKNMKSSTKMSLNRMNLKNTKPTMHNLNNHKA